MDNELQNPAHALPSSSRVRWGKRAGLGLAVLVGLYLCIAYLMVPLLWEDYESHRPAFDDSPHVTETGDKHPGDPLNVALVGTKAEVENVMALAQWHPADPLGLKSDLKIAADTVLEKPYEEAPVSSLYLFGRKEDLAFEQPVGDDPRKRHHVRFWQMEKPGSDGRPVWIGSASYDERVGISHTTGQITHHISPDVDRERDHLAASVEATRELSETFKLSGFHKTLEGRNGGGDPWHTDGDLWVGLITVRN